MTSALQPLASASSSTVLPVPNPPGTAALPPCATGNRQSMIRWPVTIGTTAGKRRRTGRGARTGQSWHIETSRRPPSAVRTVQTVASSRWLPGAATDTTSPPMCGGATTACTRPLGPVASPIIDPGGRTSPGFTREA